MIESILYNILTHNNSSITLQQFYILVLNVTNLLYLSFQLSDTDIRLSIFALKVSGEGMISSMKFHRTNDSKSNGQASSSEKLWGGILREAFKENFVKPTILASNAAPDSKH